MPMIQEGHKKIHPLLQQRFIWLDVVLLLLLGAYIVAGIDIVPFHGDEATYVWMSQDYDYIVKDRNPRAVLFDPERTFKDRESHIRLSIGSILGLTIGFARDITNVNIPVNDDWEWTLPYLVNVSEGRIPNLQLLMLARVCSAIMSALGMVFFFLIVCVLFHSRLAAWMATLAFATQGDLLLSFRRAMQEGPKFLFILLVIYLGAQILQDMKQMQFHKYRYMLFGLAGGLVLAAKQDTVPMLLAVYIALALIPLWQRQTTKVIFSNLLSLSAAGFLVIGVFLLFMPVFWAWWETSLVLIGLSVCFLYGPQWNLSRTAKLITITGCITIIGMTIVSPSLWRKLTIPFSSMVETRREFIKPQLRYYTQNHLPYLNTASHKISFLLSSTLTSRVMYMESPSFDVKPIHDQIAAYEASPLSGRINMPVLDGLIAVLFFIGIWCLIKYFNMESLFVFSLLIITVVFLLVSIPLPWQRYFLILQIPYALIAGAGAGQIWEWVNKLKAKNLPHKTEAGSS